MMRTALLLVASGMLLTGCATTASEPPSLLCLFDCSRSRQPMDDPPAPPLLPSPPMPPAVPVAVTFAPVGKRSDLSALASRLLDTLAAEGRLSVVRPKLSPADLSGCSLQDSERNSCLADIAARSKLPQQVIVVVEHPGWASRAARISCIGPIAGKAREESVDLMDAFDSRFNVSNPPKVSFTSCLIGSLHGPTIAR